MSTPVRRAAVTAALVLALAAGPTAPATGQEPNGESNLGDEPPVQLGDGQPGGRDDDGREDGAQPRTQLADTGAESLLVGLTGMGLLLAGTGLRLRVRVGR